MAMEIGSAAWHVDIQRVPLLKLHERGAVIREATIYRGPGINAQPQYPPFDFEAGRSALLFAERIVLAEQNVIKGYDAEILRAYMQSLSPHRATCRFEGTIGAEDLEATGYRVLSALEKREPGLWSMWRSPQIHFAPPNLMTPGAAFRLSIQDAIVVPARSTPPAELISFRDRHRTELSDLRHHIEELCIAISKSGDPHEARLELEKFDLALSSYLEAVRKQNWLKAILPLDVDMDWAAAIREAMTKGAVPAALGGIFGLQQAGLVVGGALAAGLTIKQTLGNRKPTKKPFAYIARAHKELK